MRYVVSDVHGHRDELVEALRSAGLLDAAGHWSGGDATLWVLGGLRRPRAPTAWAWSTW